MMFIVTSVNILYMYIITLIKIIIQFLLTLLVTNFYFYSITRFWMCILLFNKLTTLTVAHWAKLIGWSAELLHSVCMSALSCFKGNCFFTLPFAHALRFPLPLSTCTVTKLILSGARSQEIKRCNKKRALFNYNIVRIHLGERGVCFCLPLAALPGLAARAVMGRWRESIFLMGSEHTHTLSFSLLLSVPE